MPVTLGTLISRIRSPLDETTARFWTDAELTTWINDALRDIARRSETVQSFNTSITVVAATNKYTLPANVIRVHRMEFVPTGQAQIYPLEAANYQTMDAMWGVNQSSQGTPRFYVLWGYPPSLQVQLFPVPNVGGTLNLFYYRLPATLVNTGDQAELPEGWEDAVVTYVESEAKRKDRDESWVMARQLYEQKVDELIRITRQWHDQANSFQLRGTYVPQWLYGFEDE